MFHPSHLVLEDSSSSHRLVIEQYTSAELDSQTNSRANSRSRADSALSISHISTLARPLSGLYTSGMDTCTERNRGTSLLEADKPPEVRLVYPVLTIYVLFATLCYFVAVNTTMAEVPKCSPGYWIVLALSYPGLAGIIYWAIGHTSSVQTADPSSVLAGDLDFTENQVLRPLMSFCIGECLVWLHCGVAVLCMSCTFVSLCLLQASFARCWASVAASCLVRSC